MIIDPGYLALFLNLFVWLQTWSYKDIEQSGGYCIAIIFYQQLNSYKLGIKRSDLCFNYFKSQDETGLPQEKTR